MALYYFIKKWLLFVQFIHFRFISKINILCCKFQASFRQVSDRYKRQKSRYNQPCNCKVRGTPYHRFRFSKKRFLK